MGDRIESFEDLEVYQLALALQQDVFELTKTFPKEETYSLTDQIRRSSRSIGANISEAWLPAPLPAHRTYRPEGRDEDVCCVCH